MVQFGKVNSKRMYFLELQNDVLHLMVEVRDDNQGSSMSLFFTVNVYHEILHREIDCVVDGR